MKRVETIQDESVRGPLVEILSGYIATNPNTRIMFCKDTFDYPELETHDLLCNHLAPKLSGRPRGRRKKTFSETLRRNQSPVSDSNESEVSECSVKARIRPEVTAQLGLNKRPSRTKNRSECSDALASTVKKKPIKLTVRKTTSRGHTIVKNEDDYDEDDDEDADELVKEEDDDEDEETTTKGDDDDDNDGDDQDDDDDDSEKDSIMDLKKTEKVELSRVKTEKGKTKGKDECNVKHDEFELSADKKEEAKFLKKLYDVLRTSGSHVPRSFWLELRDSKFH